MPAPAITIRSARSDDAAELARLSSQLGYPSTSADLSARLELLSTRKDHEVFVAEGKTELVGWLHVLCDIHLESGDFVEIAGLVVDERHRGEGVGKTLLAAAERWARERGFTSIRVRTNVVRTRTHAFYAGAGYVLAKEQKVFVKSLKSSPEQSVPTAPSSS
jgi:GNAT superfamily N-acetyltransferase